MHISIEVKGTYNVVKIEEIDGNRQGSRKEQIQGADSDSFLKYLNVIDVKGHLV